MSYSITPILHSREDRNGLRKLQIRVIYQRLKIYLKTPIKIKENQLKDGQIFAHISAAAMNALLRQQIIDAEAILLKAAQFNTNPDKVKQLLNQEKSSGVLFSEYIVSLAVKSDGKYSAGFIRHMCSLGSKIEELFPGLTFSEIDDKWMDTLEARLRRNKLEPATINTNLKRIKSFLYKAAEDGLIDRSTFDRYKVPTYKQKLVEYLSETEIEAMAKVIRVLNHPSMQQSGYYFLLSCYTGWRMSDCKAFDYSEMVHGSKITLRAKKNGQIVSIPIHTRLKEVLKYVKSHPFDLPEQKVRDYVKDIALSAGIKKKVKFHTGRHSFAMLLMANGFTIDEVAELIGDSPLITKVYARVHNESLDKKVRERLG